MPLNRLKQWPPISVNEGSKSQLVPTNNCAVLSFFDEYPAIPVAAALDQSNDFVDCFNGNTLKPDRNSDGTSLRIA